MNITPEQALANLDAIAAQTNLNREQHAILAESLRILSELIKTKQDDGE